MFSKLNQNLQSNQISMDESPSPFHAKLFSCWPKSKNLSQMTSQRLHVKTYNATLGFGLRYYDWQLVGKYSVILFWNLAHLFGELLVGKTRRYTE